MKVLEQIRTVRECKNLSQEEMAAKVNMTVSGYSKLERGENRLHVDTLMEIAKALDIDVKDLLSVEGKAPIYVQDSPSQINQSSMYHSSYYYVVGDVEVEKLTAQIKHLNDLLMEKQSVIQQQAKRLEMAEEMIDLLKAK